MHVLVTGGNGYLGKPIVKYLLNAGHQVTVASHDYSGMDNRAQRANCDIFSKDENIFQTLGKPDACIHLAWKDGFVHNSRAHMENLSDHLTFCNNMINGGLKILSCIGTVHEIGYWVGAIDENTPCNPQSQYGIAKNAMRQSLLLSAKQSDCTLHWLRGFYITSNDGLGNNIFSKILRSEQKGEKLFPFTSGLNKYDFMDIDRFAECVCKVSLQTKVNGITNICTGEPMTLSDSVESFIRDNGLKIKLDYGAFPDRPYDSPGIWGDPGKLKTVLQDSVRNE